MNNNNNNKNIFFKDNYNKVTLKNKSKEENEVSKWTNELIKCLGFNATDNF